MYPVCVRVEIVVIDPDDPDAVGQDVPIDGRAFVSTITRSGICGSIGEVSALVADGVFDWVSDPNVPDLMQS